MPTNTQELALALLLASSFKISVYPGDDLIVMLSGKSNGLFFLRTGLERD